MPFSPLVDISAQLHQRLKSCHFSTPVHMVYHPLAYAWQPHCCYLERYGQGYKQVLLVGMNPGPFGMAQTGVPFGAIPAVRDWMGIVAPVDKPMLEHCKRPITGFACPRVEVSGQRLWRWATVVSGSAEAFFKRFFVINYCPLLFLEASGKNFTPDKLAKQERQILFAACDSALQAIVDQLQPQAVIGIGVFAAQRVKEALQHLSLQYGVLPHPSPANPASNTGWTALAQQALRNYGIV